EEEQDFGDFTQVMAQRLDHHSRGVTWIMAARLQQRQDGIGAQHQYGPGEHCGEDRGGRLVDLQRVFEGYAQIAYDKYDSHEDIHRNALFLVEPGRVSGICPVISVLVGQLNAGEDRAMRSKPTRRRRGTIAHAQTPRTCSAAVLVSGCRADHVGILWSALSMC